MAGKKWTKKPRRRHTDPRQLHLFADALNGRSEKAPAAPAKRKALRASKHATPIDRPAILTPAEAAIYLNVSVSTLKSWRAQNKGPKWRHRAARLVGYLPAALDEYLASAVDFKR
jgi:DNA-binding transcriptional regulator YiaG